MKSEDEKMREPRPPVRQRAQGGAQPRAQPRTLLRRGFAACMAVLLGLLLWSVDFDRRDASVRAAAANATKTTKGRKAA